MATIAKISAKTKKKKKCLSTSRPIEELEQSTVKAQEELVETNAIPTVQNDPEPLTAIEEQKSIETSTVPEVRVTELVSSTTNEEQVTMEKSDQTVPVTLQVQADAEDINVECISVQSNENIDTAYILPYTETQLEAFYINNEITLAVDFTKQFIESELRPDINGKKHLLYELLNNYLQERKKMTDCLMEIDELRKELQDTEKNLFIVETQSVNLKGECHDKQSVSAKCTYDRAKMDENIVTRHLQCSKQINNLVLQAYTLQSYLVELLYLQIDQYIKQLEMQQSLDDVRISISILFSFQRLTHVDKIFISKSRNWLCRLVSVLLRKPKWQDHLYILNHLLRCPSGVGEWGSSYLQLSSPVNNIIALLHIILSPIEKRHLFLNLQPDVSDIWVVVDSDGEELDDDDPCLRENDLVAFLNQIPFSYIFTSILHVTKRDDEYIINVDKLDDLIILRLISFANSFVKLLNFGLCTYRHARYNQFSKHLCRLMHHILQYVTEIWQIYSTDKNSETVIDVNMRKRLHIEYDNLIFRAVNRLFDNRTLASWQFISILPYNLISIDIIWKIFRLLHDNVENLDQFVDILLEKTDAQCYYLLNAIANLVLARTEPKDTDFIITGTLELLHIGFISEHSRDVCWKNVQSLLINIITKFPNLISIVLQHIQTSINPLCIFLFESLPLNLWQLSNEDTNIIEQWLMSEPNALENALGRMMLPRLNWESISHNVHYQIALILIRLVDQHSDWCWSMAMLLNLHQTDLSNVWNQKDVDSYPTLRTSVLAKEPLGCFLSILITSWGHLVPLILTKGLRQLVTLLEHKKYEAVLVCLHHLLPLFLNAQETLINCDIFQDVLQRLLKCNSTRIINLWTDMIVFQITQGDHCKSFIYMWMNSLLSLPNWNKDACILNLLNVIIRLCFCHSDGLHVASYSFTHVLQNSSDLQQHQMGMSFLSKWILTDPNLPLNLSAHPYLAYFIIRIEFQERELKTGLWHQILLELKKQSGRTSVDAAIKRACALKKTQPFYSSALSIYRWAQQALDTPLEHPVLPLIWQEFFTLYLMRFNDSEMGCFCIGERFFHGVINQTFFKKLKRNLNDAAKISNLFKTFALWLEEPRLQESNLLLPDLPAVYEPTLLTLIFQGDSAPWINYFDFKVVTDSNKQSIEFWRTFRWQQKVVPNSKLNSEDISPVQKIIKRLSSYESPKPLPVVTRETTEIFRINTKQDLDTYLKILLRYSHDAFATTKKSEQLHIEYCQLLPQTFKTFDLQFRKRISCGAKCSGPALLTFSTESCKINPSIQSSVQINRNQYDSLLDDTKKSSSSYSLCIASMVVLNYINMENDEAVELFYKIVSFVDDKTIGYPPTKYLFSKCLNILGGLYVKGCSNQQWELLHTLLKCCSNMCQQLIQHFTPNDGHFLILYNVICNHLDNSNALDILTKFDVNLWLNGSDEKSQPKLNEISQLIDLSVTALSSSELPLNVNQMFRNHLQQAFVYQFPQHYGEILTKLLNAEEPSVFVWLDIINTLSDPIKLTRNETKQLRRYATDQTLLSHHVLLDTMLLFAKHFSQERFKQQQYGLYKKYNSNGQMLTLLMSMTGHAAVISTVNVHQGSLANKICEILWPYIRDMYSPWLVPICIPSSTEVVQPWMPDDTVLAKKTLDMFSQTICFMMETLPACNIILNYIWQWYATYFTHHSIQLYVYQTVHPVLLTLPWHRFMPMPYDIELMFKIVGQYLPECHMALGYIFMQVPWIDWLQRYTIASTSSALSDCKQLYRLHQCLLNLLVKLCNEPNIREKYTEKETAKALLLQWEEIDWKYLDSSAYQQIMDWFVTSYDPTVIFCSDPTDLDVRVLSLLRTIAVQATAETKHKIFFKCFLKFVTVLCTRHRAIVSSNRIKFNEILVRHLNQINLIVGKGANPDEDLKQLLVEVLTVCSKLETCRDILMEWLRQEKDSTILICAIKHIGICVSNITYAVNLYEVALCNYFSCNVDTNSVRGAINNNLETVLISEKNIFCLYLVMIERTIDADDYNLIFNTLIKCLLAIDVTQETTAKLYVLWSLVIQVLYLQSLKNESHAASMLKRFIAYMKEAGTEKSWTPKILGAIGLYTRESSFCIVCRVFSTYLTSQLNDDKVRRTPDAPFCLKQMQQETNDENLKRFYLMIQDPINSLENATDFLHDLVVQYYTQPYLKLITVKCV